MKKILLGLCAFMAFSVAEAQYYSIKHTGGNPGALNADLEYPPGGGLVPGWNTLVTGSAATLATPVWSSNVNIPFAFAFNGSLVNSYKVSTSGVLTFTTAATTVPSANNSTLPSADIPDNSVMVWGLNATAGDFIITRTFGTSPNQQHWIQFNSFSHPGNANIYTYWSIVLEETTNKIYLVDQRTANGALTLTGGIQVNSTTAYQIAASPNLGSESTGDPSPADNVYYAFTPGVHPAYDMSVLSVTNATYLVLASAPFNITGVIRNLGTTPVTSFTLNYKINGGATVSAPVTANIASLGTFQFSHPTGWTPTATGNYTIEAWASDINGSNADMDLTNDSGSKEVHVVANVAQRTVLHEVLTSSTCGPCLEGNGDLRAITQANPGKSIDIKYQQNFPGLGNDPYQSAESIARRNYYGVSGIPHLKTDGGGVIDDPRNYSASALNNARSKPALVNISGTHTINGHTVTAQATIDPMGNNIPSNNLVAYMVITEKRTIHNRRTNGETEFFDVMKKMMPDDRGTAIAPLTGSVITLNQAYTFPTPVQIIAPKNIFPDSVENLNNLDVVIFLQDRVTKEVFQAAKSVGRVTTGMGENQLAHSLNVYPNPTNGKVNITFTPEKAENATLEIYNALGARVWNTSISAREINGKFIEADLSGQANGFYFLNLKYGDQVITKKIALIK